ncbi:imm11 family protein [Flavisolibacter ginsenosidimutans]|uniref:Immunity MXAN-0049 protein domain-containing protein n=1 Tax=Flavisolibacter ginsenosidimutans TaxID=661481 RepID=A0A5B8UJR6_9BACT|nr:DUF1629 domain-containing protein [Flavisolibacter ginsenosidimutans]QEC56818.1 hypothetical protein FSB75_13225 [Flavisolibacter ginsenosidimutans]
MAVWSLVAATDYTEFHFLEEKDRSFFQETVTNCFEKLNSVMSSWRPLYMFRGEPKKHPDFFEIDATSVIAISQKAVDRLKQFLEKDIELLPLETDAGRYYVLNVMNIVDCLNKNESVYTSTNNGLIAAYTSLEFIQEKIADNVIFKIPELPYHTFITDEIQDRCETEKVKGLMFDPELNLVWDIE